MVRYKPSISKMGSAWDKPKFWEHGPNASL